MKKPDLPTERQSSPMIGFGPDTREKVRLLLVGYAYFLELQKPREMIPGWRLTLSRPTTRHGEIACEMFIQTLARSRCPPVVVLE